MKTMYKIISMLICFFIGLSSVCLADIADSTKQCMVDISNNDGFQKTIEGVFKVQTTLTPDEVKEHVKKAKDIILSAAAEALLYECPEEISEFAGQKEIKVWFYLNDQLYGTVFKTSDLFDSASIRAGIMIYNKPALRGTIIEQSSIPVLYWPNACSDHIIRDGHNDKAAVNVAGQSVFTEFGGSDNEFFLDFEEGNDRRVFPGLVIMEDHHNGLFGKDIEKLVHYKNIQTAIAKAQNFANSLQGTACTNEGLRVFVVGLDVGLDKDNNAVLKPFYGNDGSAIEKINSVMVIGEPYHIR